MTLESLARTIAKARHGTDAMCANYLPSARAVMDDVCNSLDQYDTSEGFIIAREWRATLLGKLEGRTL
jgi:hypothetical protein